VFPGTARPPLGMASRVVEYLRGAGARARTYVVREVRERTEGVKVRVEERLGVWREGYAKVHAQLTYHSTALTVAGTGLSGAAAWFSYTGRAIHQTRLEQQLQQLHEDFATLHMKDVPKEVAQKVRKYEQEQEVTAWSVAWYQVPLLPLAAGVIVMGGYRAGGNAAKAKAARRLALEKMARAEGTNAPSLLPPPQSAPLTRGP